MVFNKYPELHELKEQTMCDLINHNYGDIRMNWHPDGFRIMNNLSMKFILGLIFHESKK